MKMVSSGTVKGDLSSLKSALNKYKSEVSTLNSNWKGRSSESLIPKFEEFVSEYTSAIEGQMNSFATACDLYEKYKTTKEKLETAQAGYDSASAAGDSDAARSYSQDITACNNLLKSLKAQIESSLSQASSQKLTATKITSGVINSAIDFAVGIANDDSYGYSQSTRWGNPNYDCSSLVIDSWQNAGVDVKGAGATYTGDMKNAFLSTNQFEWIPGNPNVNDLQPGDVLLTENSHTEMYIGDGKNVGAHWNYDGANGDSSGKEVNVQNYYSHPWQGVLRYTGKTYKN